MRPSIFCVRAATVQPTAKISALLFPPRPHASSASEQVRPAAARLLTGTDPSVEPAHAAPTRPTTNAAKPALPPITPLTTMICKSSSTTQNRSRETRRSTPRTVRTHTNSRQPCATRRLPSMLIREIRRCWPGLMPRWVPRAHTISTLAIDLEATYLRSALARIPAAVPSESGSHPASRTRGTRPVCRRAIKPCQLPKRTEWQLLQLERTPLALLWHKADPLELRPWQIA
jgi:hypothetical protein